MGSRQEVEQGDGKLVGEVREFPEPVVQVAGALDEHDVRLFPLEHSRHHPRTGRAVVSNADDRNAHEPGSSVRAS